MSVCHKSVIHFEQAECGVCCWMWYMQLDERCSRTDQDKNTAAVFFYITRKQWFSKDKSAVCIFFWYIGKPSECWWWLLADIVANGDAIGSALLVQTGRGQHQPLPTLVPLEMVMVMAIVMPWWQFIKDTLVNFGQMGKCNEGENLTTPAQNSLYRLTFGVPDSHSDFASKVALKMYLAKIEHAQDFAFCKNKIEV